MAQPKDFGCTTVRTRRGTRTIAVRIPIGNTLEEAIELFGPVDCYMLIRSCIDRMAKGRLAYLLEHPKNFSDEEIQRIMRDWRPMHNHNMKLAVEDITRLGRKHFTDEELYEGL